MYFFTKLSQGYTQKIKNLPSGWITNKNFEIVPLPQLGNIHHSMRCLDTHYLNYCLRAFCGLLFFAGVHAFAEDLFRWPTENRAFAEGRSLESFVQPTASGNLESGLFGCVRNNGYKFHEGLDLKATRWDARREALDDIYAIADGTVVHISSIAGHSSYGRYLVIEHDFSSPHFFSMYAHLHSAVKGLRVGDKVKAGEVIARMGRSASGYTIPRDRAHLHLEIGFRLSDYFESWYDAQKYTTPNKHGVWHGFNMISIDPLDFFTKYRDRDISSMKDYLETLPEDFSLIVSTRRIPNFISRYPSLLTGEIPEKGLVGWKVSFTWYGLPFRWTPIDHTQQEFLGEGVIQVLEVDKETLSQSHCRDTLEIDNHGIKAGGTLKNFLQLLFGFR